MTYFTIIIIIIIIELNMHREIIKYSDRLLQTHRFEKRVKCLIIKIIIQLFDWAQATVIITNIKYEK